MEKINKPKNSTQKNSQKVPNNTVGRPILKPSNQKDN
ncbi:MAG: hypothetical protein K0R71_1678 [Bacillales bacterium]|jgi:hypothetical protein|nr:hypothetical protein [Bacillales bacterium]